MIVKGRNSISFLASGDCSLVGEGPCLTPRKKLLPEMKWLWPVSPTSLEANFQYFRSRLEMLAMASRFRLEDLS